jgi:hypothetical protein
MLNIIQFRFYHNISGYGPTVQVLANKKFVQGEPGIVRCKVQSLPIPSDSDIALTISPSADVTDKSVIVFPENDTALATFSILPIYWTHDITCVVNNTFGSNSSSIRLPASRM